MSVFMLAALDVRHHLETYGAENLNARTLIILREKLSKDLRAGYALLLEQQRTKHSGQPALAFRTVISGDGLDIRQVRGSKNGLRRTRCRTHSSVHFA
jgi:hypothetical protein